MVSATDLSCMTQQSVDVLLPWNRIAMRKVGQLWYEILGFSCNLSPEELSETLTYSQSHQLILAMHPHGIVPFQAVLWSAYCDQYFQDTEKGISLYGFGAAADVVQHVPFLRNVLAWLGAGSASYKALYDGLVHGKAPSVNAAGRKPCHLFILPGGVAEVFTSTPKRHAIVFLKRRGLVKLSIETGAELVPCYVFGGTDFFHNLATDDGLFSKLSRRLRAGMTIFFGHFGLPLPFTPRVSMIIGKPIPVPRVENDDERNSKANDLLHAEFLKQIQELFERYKAVSGCPEAQLEVL
eukprot:scaffold2066_cov229-Ochromonas_danica.AAC.27